MTPYLAYAMYLGASVVSVVLAQEAGVPTSLDPILVLAVVFGPSGAFAISLFWFKKIQNGMTKRLIDLEVKVDEHHDATVEGVASIRERIGAVESGLRGVERREGGAQ